MILFIGSMSYGQTDITKEKIQFESMMGRVMLEGGGTVTAHKGKFTRRNAHFKFEKAGEDTYYIYSGSAKGYMAVESGIIFFIKDKEDADKWKLGKTGLHNVSQDNYVGFAGFTGDASKMVVKEKDDFTNILVMKFK
jgi:hypothetical protein